MNSKYTTTFWSSNTKSSSKYSNSDDNIIITATECDHDLKKVSQSTIKLKVPELNIINKC